MLDDQATITAIATARGDAGVAVVRISGSRAWDIGQTVFSRPDAVFKPGRVLHGFIVDPADRQTLVDEVLLLVFRGPNSYTGEDVVEIHCHGGDYLTHKILNLALQQGARMALPGEFTKRAFLNGKMDLTQAESVMDMVSAKGDRMLNLAIHNLRHRSLGQYIDTIGQTLMGIQSQIVASVDFPDEVDEPEREPLLAKLDELLLQTTQLAKTARRNQLVREGIKVALLGMPNSGKSSLFNALLALERSIVTDIAGTTRDVITETLHLGGVPVTLLDTAGIRESRNTVEAIGIERSWQAGHEAQAVLYVYDAAVGLTSDDREILSKLPHTHQLLIANKTDLVPESTSIEGQALSIKTGAGLDAVTRWLEQAVHRMTHDASDLDISLNQRQVACLQGLEEQLRLARESLVSPALPIDIATVPLTEALRKLDELMGRDTAEEVLTRVFQQFCVGK